MTIQYNLVDVTPAIAANYLTHNVHNRNLRMDAVAQYATDMRNGDWRQDGSPIRFNENGDLDDGAHRLSAIIDADVTITMLVITGLPNGAQETMDQGIKRTLGDVLHLRGEVAANDLAALVRLVGAWDLAAQQNYNHFTHKRNLSVPGALAVLEKYPELRTYVAEAPHLAKACGISRTTLGLSMFLFYGLDPTDAAYFFERLASAENHRAGEPIFALREAITNARRLVQGKRGALQPEWTTAITIKAWNAYRDGNDIQLLKWRRGGAKPEDMPQPH